MPMEASAPIPKKEFLGEILIRRGLITEKQLEHALEIQKKEKSDEKPPILEPPLFDLPATR